MAEQAPPAAAEKQPEVHRRQLPKKMKVMVAIDDSENSFYALQWVIDHFSDLMVPQPLSTEAEETAAAAEEGMLTVVHVQQPFQQFAFPAGPGGATGRFPSLITQRFT